MFNWLIAGLWALAALVALNLFLTVWFIRKAAVIEAMIERQVIKEFIKLWDIHLEANADYFKPREPVSGARKRLARAKKKQDVWGKPIKYAKGAWRG